MNHISLKNIVWKEGTYFVSQCLNVEVSSFWSTKEESLKNLNEALELYFEDTKKPKFQQISEAEIVSQDFSYA